MVRLQNKTRIYLALGAVCSIAVVVRMLPLLRSGDEWTLAGDSGTYLALARGLRMGCGFAQAQQTCGAAEVFRTPGYPALLSVLPSLRSVVVLQGLMGAAICFMVVGFVWPRWGWKPAAMAGALVALDVPSIQTSSFIVTDTLFSLLLAAAVFLQLWIISRGMLDRTAVLLAVVAAVLLGVEALVRPVGQILILAAPIPILLIRSQSRRQQAVLLLITVIIPASINLAWIARNWTRAQLFTLSAEAGYQIYFHRAAESVWFRRGASLKAQDYFDAQDYLYDRFCSAQPSYCIPYVRNQHSAQYDRPGVSTVAIPGSCQNSGRFNCSEYPNQAYRAMWRQGLQICLHDAGAVGFVTVASFVFMALNPYDSTLYQLLGTKRIKTGSLNGRYAEAMGAPIIAVVTLVGAALLFLVWSGIFLFLRGLFDGKRRADARLLLYPLLLALVLMAVQAGPLEAIQTRFRMPSIPFLAMVAAIGWCGGSVAVPTARRAKRRTEELA